MRKAVVFDAPRTGYSIEQIINPMTVGDLKELLEEMEDDIIVVASHDRGYTYGTLEFMSVCEEREGEYGPEWHDIDW